MRSRYGLLALGLFALAACKPEPDKQPGVSTGETIACAVSGSSDFVADCAVERTNADGKLFLTVHHPDGAFRRFEVMKDGSGVATADGADQAVSRLSGQVLEVVIGPDRYRFPATQTSNAAKP